MSREASQSGSQSVQDNPFLSGLSATKRANSQPNAPISDNPFLKQLSKVPPSNTSVDAFPPLGRSTTLPVSSTQTDQPLSNPFLDSLKTHAFSIGKITVQTSQNKPRVAFDPSITDTGEPRVQQKQRVPSYSEVAAAHAHGKPPNIRPQQYANLKTLHVKNIPDELNNSETLRSHFSQFGQVTLLKSFPAKKFATVEFASRVSISVCLLLFLSFHRKKLFKPKSLG